MRSAHVISSLDPAAGGPPAVLWRLAAAQASLGHEIFAIGPRDPARDDTIGESHRAVPGIEGVRVIRIPMARSMIAHLADRSIMLALDEAAPIDVLHIHATWDPPLLRASAWARRHAVPYVIRPAGMLDVWSLEQGRLKKRLAMATTHRAHLRRAAAIHALNEHEQRTIEALRLGPPVVRIPNAVFLEEVALPNDPAEFRAAFPALADAPYVLFLARLHHKKGLDILADAWGLVARDLPSHRLVVAGPRQDDSIDEFRHRIRQAGVQHTVVETGPIYGPVKSAALAGADCFVLPSRQEGFSVAITEALALGVPCVVSRECHFPEITSARAGIETSLAPADVAHALCSILTDDDLRRRAGSNAAALIRERFLWPSVAEQTIDLYLRITGRERG